MKRIAIALLAGVAAVAGLGYSASAADMAVKAAPAPVLAPSWTGFYVGVHGGAALEDSKSWGFLDPTGTFAIGSNLAVNSSTNNAGAVGGLQGGYNWQFAPAWVVGIEGDFSWTSLSNNRVINVNPAAANNSVTMVANTEWLSSVRGKLGFTGWLNNTMLYATAGAAWAGMEYNAQAVTAAGGGLNPVSSVNLHTTKSGWVVGGGAEWMATTNILLRAEYLYYGLNNGNSANNNAIGFALPFTYTWAKENVQVFRLAGSYKF
jgi:outer membrane immunogenic protein